MSVFGAQPVAPSGLTVVVQGVNLFLLEWTDNSTDETHFEVQRRQAQTAESFQTVLLVEVEDGSETGPVSVNYYVAPAEFPPSQQEFRVRAIKQGDPGIPGASNIVSVNVPAAVFGAPTGLTGVAGDGAVEISWVDHANCEVAFHVEQAIGEDGAFAFLGQTSVNQTAGIAITGLMPFFNLSLPGAGPAREWRPDRLLKHLCRSIRFPSCRPPVIW
jgi:predicted phage tail protein